MITVEPRNVILFLLVLLTSSVSCELLLRKGWYRTHHKGPKIVLNNVVFLDDKVVPDAAYLSVRARMPTIFPGSVRNLTNLRVAKFSFCLISNLMPGAFQNLPNLATLSLFDNEIDRVNAGVFSNLGISTLYLQRNQIRIVDSQAFDDMPNLYKLKINANKISVWDNNWFRNTPSLTEIFFRRNEIQTLPKDAFKNIKGSHVYNGTYIVDTKIYLSKNNISSIDPDALQGLQELSQLWLDRNQLSQLDQKVFSKVTQIGALFLSKNKLKNLPVNMFPSLSSSIDILDVTKNNNMTCLPYDIVSVVKLTNIKDIIRLDCKCVDQLVNKLVAEKKINEIKSKCQFGSEDDQ